MMSAESPTLSSPDGDTDLGEPTATPCTACVVLKKSHFLMSSSPAHRSDIPGCVFALKAPFITFAYLEAYEQEERRQALPQ